jgi:hypothetical protein
MKPNRQELINQNPWIIETNTPDGPHWFGGVHLRPGTGITTETGKVIPAMYLNMFSPYIEDAALYTAISDAEDAYSACIKSDPKFKIVTYSESSYKDSRKIEDGKCRIRAKYLMIGNIIMMEHTVFLVKKAVDDKFVLDYVRDHGFEEGNATGSGNRFIGRESSQWVTLLANNINEHLQNKKVK